MPFQLEMPNLPFEGFKWRWASKTPSEGLNRPDVYLGVLRALKENEGASRSSESLHESLAGLQTALGAGYGLNLARTGQRNLLRNSGQYWTTLGVVKKSQTIQLTDLGQRYAAREMSQREFAVHTILNFTLPSSSYSPAEVAQWEAADIRFKPLLLILEIIIALATDSSAQAYLTESELTDIVQPTSASTRDAVGIADIVLLRRRGELDTSSWPRTATGSNDRRNSREFLRFLSEYQILEERVTDQDERRYFLDILEGGDIALLLAVEASSDSPVSEMEEAVTYIATNSEQRRISRSVLDRPGQRMFRREVLSRASETCLLTGTRVASVLEAAHIRPFAISAIDDVENGLCLRADIHSLFDGNRVRITPQGEVSYSAEVLSDPSYHDLPSHLDIPEYVDPAHVEWRWNYY